MKNKKEETKGQGSRKHSRYQSEILASPKRFKISNTKQASKGAGVLKRFGQNGINPLPTNETPNLQTLSSAAKKSELSKKNHAYQHM